MEKLQDPIPIYTIGYGSRSTAKVQKYADAFLPIIRAYCQEHRLMEHNR